MEFKFKIAGIVVVVFLVLLFLGILGETTQGPNALQLPICVTAYNFTCVNLVFQNATANLTMNVGHKSQYWSSWALAYVPQGASKINGVPDVPFILQKDGFNIGENRQIQLSSSMSAPVKIGTFIAGEIWVCYSINETISSTGKGYCQGSNTIKYEKIATIAVRAS